jgi:hypothetical protein
VGELSGGHDGGPGLGDVNGTTRSTGYGGVDMRRWADLSMM